MLDTKCKKLEYINEANFTKNLETWIVIQFAFLEFFYYVQAFVRGMAIYLGLWLQLVVLTK